MARGENTAGHPGRKVDPLSLTERLKRINAGQRGTGPIKSYTDYAPEHGVPITSSEVSSRSQAAKHDRRLWEDLYGGDE